MKKIVQQFIDNVKRNKLPVLIFTHVNADPDAVASALLLKHLFNFFKIKSIVLFPGINRESKEILSKLNIYHLERTEQYSNAFYAIVDTSNSVLLDKYKDIIIRNLDKVLLIDHHYPFGDLKNARYKILENETSTTVLIAEILKIFNVSLPKSLSTLGLIGVLFDTQRFRFISLKTLEAVAYLLENGGVYDQALDLLYDGNVEYSEKIARIKGIKRADILKIKKYIVAITHVSSYEASVANALLSLGVDLAIVVGVRKNKELRISARATKKFVKDTGLYLGSYLMKELEKYLDGKGGGHDTAGGFNGRGDLYTSLKIVEKILLEKMYSSY